LLLLLLLLLSLSLLPLLLLPVAVGSKFVTWLCARPTPPPLLHSTKHLPTLLLLLWFKHFSSKHYSFNISFVKSLEQEQFSHNYTIYHDAFLTSLYLVSKLIQTFDFSLSLVPLLHSPTSLEVLQTKPVISTVGQRKGI